jgi:hypothetical protein
MDLKGRRCRIYLLLIIDLPYCWLALQYIEESSSFIDWQFDCLFICLMLKKCLSKCHDKLAAKHIVLFCLASNKNSITMLHNCSSTNRKSCSHKVFLGYKLICNNKQVIVMRRSKKDRQHKIKRKKGQITIYKAWHRKLKMWHEPH